jgi:hypothetical protein
MERRASEVACTVGIAAIALFVSSDAAWFVMLLIAERLK